MPKCFKELYPLTRVIVDAMEIFVETPALPESQQIMYGSWLIPLSVHVRNSGNWFLMHKI